MLFLKSAGRISRERDSSEETSPTEMDRAGRRGEHRPVIRVLLLSLWLLLVGLSLPLSLWVGIPVRGGLSLSASSRGGPAKSATTGAGSAATAERARATRATAGTCAAIDVSLSHPPPLSLR